MVPSLFLRTLDCSYILFVFKYLEQRTIFRQVTIFVATYYKFPAISLFFTETDFFRLSKMISKCVFTQQIQKVTNIFFCTLKNIMVKWGAICFSRWNMFLCSIYFKTLIIRVTSFSRSHHQLFIHETLFLRFAIASSIILIHVYGIIGNDFILFSRRSALANLRQNTVLANKTCFTVCRFESCCYSFHPENALCDDFSKKSQPAVSTQTLSPEDRRNAPVIVEGVYA